MVMVVLFATIAIYGLLNAVPGGPLSGLNLAADAKQRLSEEDIARLAATLGLNKPVYLAYITWMAGEDWLDEVGDAIGNPGPAEKMFETGTWRDYQSPPARTLVAPTLALTTHASNPVAVASSAGIGANPGPWLAARP